MIESTGTVGVLIVDDQAPFRDVARTVVALSPGFDVVAEAASGEEAVAATNDRHPQLVLMDINLPGMNGIELVRKLKGRGVSCPVILITGHGDVALAVEAMKAGAADFIEKPFDDAVLLGAIRAALEQRPEAGGESAAKKEAEARLAELSPRERDVLQGLVAGKINKVIAHDLSISPRTVEVYRANLMAKTGARSMSELMRIALAAGL